MSGVRTIRPAAAGENRMVNDLVLVNGTDFAQLVGAGAVGPAGENALLRHGHDNPPSIEIASTPAAVRPHKVGGRDRARLPPLFICLEITQQNFRRLFKIEQFNSEQSGRVPVELA